MDSFILCGMQFGDEGKGSFVDYLTYKEKADAIIRYNGGSQASHTVITPAGQLHKFSQLGSGMFLNGCHTYITENMVINLENLSYEMDKFSNETGIPKEELFDKIHIHEDCYLVTPYHKFINKLRELSQGKQRRGSVGTGVSEVRYLIEESKNNPFEPELGLKIKELYVHYSAERNINFFFERLYKYAKDFYEKNKEQIHKNIPEDIKHAIEKQIEYYLNINVCMRETDKFIREHKYETDSNFKRCIYTTYEKSFKKECKTLIFEGTQGLLIDKKYGIKPNTTFLDTTIDFALELSGYKDNVSKIGIAKAFYSRHGKGIFPTENFDLSTDISDENQDESFWNGQIRFGWFDAILFRYAQKVNKVDEIYLSSLDKLDTIETIKVCNEYIYNGTIDDRFKELFDYYISSGKKAIITDIKSNGDDLIDYLKECKPFYIIINGWQTKTSNITKKSELPKECIRYISLLEEVTKLPITIVSVGPTRNNKIRMYDDEIVSI